MGRPGSPVILEVNLWVWLSAVSARAAKAVTLADVPAKEWDALALPSVDAVWFMGVWERSPGGRRIALANKALMKELEKALPDMAPEDMLGSAYCVHRYIVDERLGGAEGLACAREELARRGVRLVLDFVPNHVALDHPWTVEHPEFFVRGGAADLEREPLGFVITVGGYILANGRDPYFPPWHDVVQVNAFSSGLREAAAGTLCEIAGQCDGVRCDMAMLLLNSVFSETWGQRVGSAPPEEFWTRVITAVRAERPDFMLVAEVYWGLEERLLDLGFDFCYDKRLYDRLIHGPGSAGGLPSTADEVHSLLEEEAGHEKGFVRFIENHDEARAASALPPAAHRAAALTILTLPGAVLLHQGQCEGLKVRLPVFLARGPEESVDEKLALFYRALLEMAEATGLRGGSWSLCGRSGWSDNDGFHNLMAWCRRVNGPCTRTAPCATGPECGVPGEPGALTRPAVAGRLDVCGYVVVINYATGASAGRVSVPWPELEGRAWLLNELLRPDGSTGEAYVRDGDEMIAPGLFVDLPAWGFHVLRVTAQP